MHKYARLPAVLVILSAGGWCAQKAIELPKPNSSSRAQLGRWLATRVIEQQPEWLQDQLVDRLQEELQSDWDVTSSSVSLSTGHKAELASNVEFLMYRWFVLRCTEFADVEPDQRQDFLDTQIAFVKLFQNLSESAEGNSFLGKIEAWRGRVPSDFRPTADASVSAAFVRWLETCSLKDLPTSSVTEIANRIADRLDCGVDVKTIPMSRSEIWQTNAATLMRAWFVAQADYCDQLPLSDRRAFAQTVLSRIRAWNMSAIPGGSAPDANGAIGDLAQNIETWIAEADGEEQARLCRFRGLIRQALLAELFQVQRELFR